MDELKQIALNEGYKIKSYGYFKEGKVLMHWITFFKNRLQMYAYYIEDKDCEKTYDTGCIKVSSAELQTLINVFKPE